MLKLLAFVLPLGLDSFAVAAALGTAALPAQQRWRISAIFVIFEAGMPSIGLAAAALLAVGAWMLLDRDDSETGKAQALLSKRGAVISLGLAVLGSDAQVSQRCRRMPGGRRARHCLRLRPDVGLLSCGTS
jgi:hypothetical protein